MALNFKLSYNDGFGYTSLLPNTQVEAIVNNENIFKYSTLEVDIPTTTNMIQTIPVPMSAVQKVAPFTFELMTEGAQAKYDYLSISQIETTESGLKIIRLRSMPKKDIRIKLRFRERGVT